MLEVIQLHKRYGDVVALDGVSLSVTPGQLVGFVGANGAGKTTTMRIVLGVLDADRGEVRWHGEPITSATRQRFGYMPEERGLYPKMRVLDQLSYFAQLHGTDRSAAEQAARRWVERLGVAQRAGDRLETLSLGNQQRVQLAAALVHDPELLVLDEPFSGLDPVGTDVLAEVLVDRVRAGAAVVFSSHQLDLVERLCDQVVVVNHGRVVADGDVGALRARRGERRWRVEVTDADPNWFMRVPGAHAVERRNGSVTLQADGHVDDQVLLDAARAAGRVVHFSRERPSLAELYREVVQP